MYNKKVVVVDDDQKVLITIEKTLRQIGFEVFTTGDGKKALELIEREIPDLVISDILQPGMDGILLCQEIKKTPAYNHIKIILITGVFNRSNMTRITGCTPDAFIEKPIDMPQLATLIQQTLKI